MKKARLKSSFFHISGIALAITKGLKDSMSFKPLLRNLQNVSVLKVSGARRPRAFDQGNTNFPSGW
jgi:hypothetical protein